MPRLCMRNSPAMVQRCTRCDALLEEGEAAEEAGGRETSEGGDKERC